MALSTPSPLAASNFSNGSATKDPDQLVEGANSVPDALLYPLMVSCVVAVLENLTVCILIAANRTLRTATNTFVFSLCAADICFAALILPIHCFYRASGIYGYIVLISIITYVLNLTAVTYERLVSLTNPLRYHAIITKRFALNTILVAWAIPVPYCLIPAIWQGNATKLAHKVYMSCTLVIFLLIPLIFILFVYGRIFVEIRKLYEHRKQLVLQPKKRKKKVKDDTESNLVIEASFSTSAKTNHTSTPRKESGRYLRFWKKKNSYKCLRLVDVTQPHSSGDKQGALVGNGSVDIEVQQESSQGTEYGWNEQLPADHVNDKRVGCSFSSDLNKMCGTCCCTSQTLLEILNAGKREHGQGWSDLSLVNGQFKQKAFGSEQNLSTLFVRKSSGDCQPESGRSASCSSVPNEGLSTPGLATQNYDSLQRSGKFSGEVLFESRPCCYLVSNSTNDRDGSSEDCALSNEVEKQIKRSCKIKGNSRSSVHRGIYVDDCNANPIFLKLELRGTALPTQEGSLTRNEHVDGMALVMRRCASESDMTQPTPETRGQFKRHRMSFPLSCQSETRRNHLVAERIDFSPVGDDSRFSHGILTASSADAQEQSSSLELMARRGSDEGIDRSLLVDDRNVPYTSLSWPRSLPNIVKPEEPPAGPCHQTRSNDLMAVPDESVVSNHDYGGKEKSWLSLSCLGQHLKRRGKQLSRSSITSEEKRRKSHVDKFKTVVAELKSSLAFAAVAFTYMFTWLPVGYMTFLDIIGRSDLVPKVLSDVSVFTIALNAVIDPLLYALLLRDFKKYSRRCFRRLCGIKQKYNEWQ